MGRQRLRRQRRAERHGLHGNLLEFVRVRSYRQLSAARIAHAAVASKLSKLEDDSHAVVVWCAAPKRDGVAKKLAKYNEKSGDRIGVAWAD